MAPQGQNLERIEEADGDNAKANVDNKCEICPNDEVTEEDLAVNEEMSKSIPDEENLKNAYNAFRQRKGLTAVDFTTIDYKSSPHKVQLCFNCLFDCFQARRVEANDYELDEVSAYRGTMMEGIGIKQNGRYPRKLGDELGLQRKRPFDKT